MRNYQTCLYHNSQQNNVFYKFISYCSQDKECVKRIKKSRNFPLFMIEGFKRNLWPHTIEKKMHPTLAWPRFLVARVESKILAYILLTSYSTDKLQGLCNSGGTVFYTINLFDELHPVNDFDHWHGTHIWAICSISTSSIPNIWREYECGALLLAGR